MEDLISRQAAIDMLTSVNVDVLMLYDSRDVTTVIDYVHRVTNELQALQPEPQWIPCSERTPEENGRYLTTNSSWGYFEVDWNVWINGEWLYPNENPVAWMPMPKPWKGESE